MAEFPVPAAVGDTAEDNELPEGMTQDSMEVGSIPSEFDISSMEVRRIQAVQSFDLGSELDVAQEIFNRPEDSDDPVGEGEGEGQDAESTSIVQSEWWTDRPDQPVKIRFGTSQTTLEEPETIVQLFERVVMGYSEHVALTVKRAGEWRQWTYRKYHDECVTVAKAMIALGLEPYHGVCILGFNSPEWHITSMATIMACGMSVGLYLTSSPDACYTIAESSKANIVVVENDSQLQKILQVRDKLPHLKAIVQYSKEVTEKEDGLLDWRQLMMLGQRTPDTKLKQRMAMIQPSKCCILIYTSGTTGQSKGVMLNHDNMTWTSRRVICETKITMGNEHIVSYLPLSHVATQLLDIYIAMASAGTCWFAQPDALKGSLLQTMKEVHPTIFLGVPRVWEKIAESMQLVARNTTGLKSKISSWAKGVGYKGNITKQTTGNSKRPFGWTVANWVFFKKVRQALGLDRCHFPMCSAAPISQDTLQYFMSVNIPLHEIYGMSECSGPTTVTTVDRIRFMSSGHAVDGVELMIRDPDEEGVGEVMVRGRHVFMGYLGCPKATQEVLDDQGWLRSGDVGYISKEGFLFITGRKKEIIITAGGEKIAPVPIENAIKHALPIVSNAMVIGENKKYLSCLITLKVVIDDVTEEPTRRLTEVATEECQRIGSSALTVNDILDNGGDHKVLKMIQKGIDGVNKKAPSRAQKIAKWSILEQDFCIATGELTPTLKLKRKDIMMKYADCIESFYSS